MKKPLFSAIIIVLFLIAVFASIKCSHKSLNNGNKITVVTTLFPMYDFAKIIGGDKVEVSLLLPPGVEPHSFEPKPSDIARINQAAIFIYTGEFMEPWAKDIIAGISGKKIIVVDSSTGVNMIPAAQHHEHHEHEGLEHHDAHNEHEIHEEHEHGFMDPHIWLDFNNCFVMIDNITKAFCEKDPANAEFYKHNADEYKNKLTQLDEKYKTALTNCKMKTIVYGGHYAFGYLANRYGLQYLAAQGLSPDAEPTAKDIVELVEQIKKDNISYIFYEELTSPKIAETLANETKTKMLLLNAAHNISRKDLENNVSFFSIMENNLTNLKTGLGCE